MKYGHNMVPNSSIKTNLSIVLLGISLIWFYDCSAQKTLVPHTFIGYDFFPESYYIPTNNTNESYIGSSFDSKYIFIRAFSPTIGFGLDYSIKENQSLTFDGSFSIFRTVYDIEDRSKQFYYPFGKIELENHAWQITLYYKYHFANKYTSNYFFSISTGPFVRYHLYRKNVIQDDIDEILKSFPLSRSNMNSFIWGIKGQGSLNIRYYGSALTSRFVQISLSLDYNSLGMLKDQTGVFSIGLQFAIEF